MSNYLTDEEARDLAQKFTQWNGSHAITNYPMLLNAAIAAYLRKHGEPGDVPSYCPKCGSEEWDEVFERGYPPPIARRCARCDTEWNTK